MSLDLVITTAGRAALVNASNTGTLPVTISQIGISATFTAPAEGLTALPAEIKRLSTIAGEVVASDTIHVTLKDESADDYSLRSMALYLADGTLFACAGQSAAILTKTASSVALAAIDIAFADVAAASITFGDTDFTLPTATIDRLGVVELATQAEADAGTDAARTITPATAKAALLQWLLAQDGSGSGIDADMLDGLHGAAYLKAADFLAPNQNGGATSGFQKLPGGMLLQRGSLLCTRRVWTDVPFFTPFPNACRSFQVTLLDPGSLTAITDQVTGKIISASLARIGVVSTLSSGAVLASWLAFGE